MATINSIGLGLSGAIGTADFAGTTSPTFTTPTLGVAAATSINFGGSSLSTYIAPVSFTPILKIGNSTTGITYTTQQGIYSQVGGVVTFAISIVLSSTGGLSGACTMNLPVAVNSGLSAMPFPILLTGATITGPFLQALMSFPAFSDRSIVSIIQVGVTGTAVIISGTALANTSEIYISGSYPV